MTFDELMTCVVTAYRQYKASMVDKKLTVGELQEMIKALSDAAIDTFDVRDTVLIDVTGK